MYIHPKFKPTQLTYKPEGGVWTRYEFDNYNGIEIFEPTWPSRKQFSAIPFYYVDGIQVSNVGDDLPEWTLGPNPPADEVLTKYISDLAAQMREVSIETLIADIK